MNEIFHSFLYQIVVICISNFFTSDVASIVISLFNKIKVLRIVNMLLDYKLDYLYKYSDYHQFCNSNSLQFMVYGRQEYTCSRWLIQWLIFYQQISQSH